MLKNSKFRKFNKNPSVRQQLSNSKTVAYKKFGQNFLLDKTYIDFMIKGLDLNKTDFVIEIGPGMGALSEHIIKKITINNYLAIEIDLEKIPFLLNEYPGINILNISVLDFNIDQYCKDHHISNYKIIGSLPFNISKKIIQSFSECSIKAQKAVFMVQKEVGEDFIGKNGTTFLNVYLSLYWKIMFTCIIPSNAFFPQPKVDGMALILNPKDNEQIDHKFIKFVKRGFGQPRKKLGNVLLLSKPHLFYNKRAHEISIEEWKSLYLEQR